MVLLLSAEYVVLLLQAAVYLLSVDLDQVDNTCAHAIIQGQRERSNIENFARENAVRPASTVCNNTPTFIFRSCLVSVKTTKNEKSSTAGPGSMAQSLDSILSTWK